MITAMLQITYKSKPSGSSLLPFLYHMGYPRLDLLKNLYRHEDETGDITCLIN